MRLEITVRLTIRDGLIADIRILGAPDRIELLYLDGCPNHETFLPHLNDLILEHGIVADIGVVRIDNDDDARTHRFLGSPTVRVNGHDIEPATAERQLRHTDRSYAIHVGSTPSPTALPARPSTSGSSTRSSTTQLTRLQLPRSTPAT